MKRPEAKNTYKLPTGEPIRRALKTAFRSQRRQILASLTGKKAAGDLPDELPEFRLGNLAMSERMAPLIEAYWDKAGTQLLSRVGVDPDAWDVRNPEVEAAIDKAALDFSASTNQTTSLALDQALAKTRAELTAGVFTKGEALPTLTKRINAIFDAAPTAQTAVVIIGAITLVMGAIIGCAKDDIKKALAGSTMSQIGYMMLAAGIGPAGYAFAIFHLLTHGFFKANMFLGAGSVMHAMDDDVNMRRYGGLRRVLPITFVTFAAGWLSIRYESQAIAQKRCEEFGTGGSKKRLFGKSNRIIRY